MKIRNINFENGFTLMELLISIAIIAILMIVSFATFWGARGKSDVTGTAQEAASLLRQAQSQAMSGVGGSAWGVHFYNNGNASFFALFSSAYSTSTVTGRYLLPTTVAYLTSTLSAGSSTDIIFAPIIGTASASTSIGFYSVSMPSQSSTISIASSGAVSY